jgi:transposase InsO family protein
LWSCPNCSDNLTPRAYIALLAEVLFLRRQLAMVVERGLRPRRARRFDRLLLVMLSRFFDWRSSLVVIRPATLVRWQRDLVRRVWRWKSRPTGRPRVPAGLRTLIRRMAAENPSWGCRRIADELRVKLGIAISSRTVRKYLPKSTRPRGRSRDQAWATFVRNPARAVFACDFVVSTTASFRTIYTLVVMEIGSRRILHVNSTAHPTAAWTTQQLREVFVPEHPWRYLLHDRDAIFSAALDATARSFGLSVLKSPPRCPKANAFCERLIGTLRRECLDWIIPLSEGHLRSVIREWTMHYNRGRPHTALHSVLESGPAIPAELQPHRHRLSVGQRVLTKPILGGLHHEYSLDRAA